MENQNFENSFIFPKGTPADPSCFVGGAWSYQLIEDEDCYHCPTWNVTFAPGGRNNWHSHVTGQILLVTAGRGYYQEEGQSPRLIVAGDVVKIPPHVKHWHGATPKSGMVHLAYTPNANLGGTSWLEPVNPQDYEALEG